MLVMVEFSSGSGVMAEEFKRRGWKTHTVDYIPEYHPNHVIDLRESFPEIPEHIDFFWGGTDCTGFSIAAVGTNWKDGKPNETAQNSILLLLRHMQFCMLTRPTYYALENPVGMMRKMPFMELIKPKTISMCQYGSNSMKPTDLFTNIPRFHAKLCRRGSDCHEAAPRGSKTGTQGKKGSYDRSQYPEGLCVAIADAVEAALLIAQEEKLKQLDGER